MSTDTIQGWLISADQTYLSGTQLRADVVDYDLADIDQPKIILQPTPDAEPFFVFMQKFNVGDTISVTVVEHDTFPGDYLVALIVKEPQSKLEIVMEPNNLGFTIRGFAVKAIPLGTSLQVVVESIDIEQHRVYLSCLPFAEEHLNKILAQKRATDNIYEVNAIVGEVHNVRKRVFFTLEWSELSQGLVYVIGIAGRGLYKPAEDHLIGETYKVKLWFKDKPSHKALAKLPDEIEPLIGEQRGFKRLSWENGNLYFSGRMPYNLRNELQSPTKDMNYRKAIDDLYHFSNQPMADIQWAEDFEIKVGMQFPEAKVLRLAHFGAFVEIKPGLEGLIHKSQMTWDGEDPEDVVKVGELVDAHVIKVDIEKRQIGLSMLNPQDDPWRKYNAGDRVSGKVTRVEKYGAFVELKPGITGLVYIKEISWDYVSDIHDEVETGDEVDVKILDVDLDKRRMSLSMKQA